MANQALSIVRKAKNPLEPVLLQQVHPTKNIDIIPESLNKGSHKIIWWLGPCTHEWEAAIDKRALRGDSCPYCSGHRVLAGFNDLKTTHPEIAAEWHPYKNGNLLVTSFSAGSNCKVWWLGKCSHSWEAFINNRSKGATCPFCSNKKVHETNSLACRNPKLASEWHPTKNGDLTPDKVLYGSHKKVWWLGPCTHEWEASIYKRAKGTGCPVCVGKVILIGFNDLHTTHPILAKQLHPIKNGETTGHCISQGSDKFMWWLCEECDHEWEATISSRVRGNGCPRCAVLKNNFISQPEKYLYEFITGLGFAVNQSDRSVLKNVSARELDLFVPERMFAVEFNGLYWHSELAGKGPEYHLTKFTAARAAGVELFQVWEDDWMNRRDAVLHTIASRLDATQSVPSGKLSPVELTVPQASEFLDVFCIQGAVSADVFYGLQDDAGTVHAVLALDVDTHSAEVVRFVSRGNTGSGFVELLTHAVDVLQLSTVFTVVDNAVNHAGVFEEAGFVKTEEIAPAAYSIVNAMRVADASGMNRIWDAGKTKYRFSA